MPVAIAAFSRAHPAVQLSLTQADPEDSLPALRAGELDIAITHAGGAPGDRESEGVLHVHELEDPMLLVLPRDHRLAAAPTVRLADLAAEPWVTSPRGSECVKQIEVPCLRAGFQPRIAFETGDFAAMQGFVAAGVGVSLIPELGLRTLRDDIAVRSLGEDTPVRQIFASVSKAYRSPATEAMLAAIQATSVVEAARRPALEAAA
jgi:DNA-binding transcriptional LysR family regulator